LAGALERARELLTEVEQLTDVPSICSECLQNLAAIEHAEGNHWAALELCQRALEYEPDSGVNLFNVANAFCLLGQHDRALSFLDRALRSQGRYSILEHVLQDCDFKVLRTTREFKRFVEDLLD
jgi:tetratricopeptide (TPR) repeat protein